MLKFKIIKEAGKCRELWDKFSPKKILWDLWDFRHCFHNEDFEFYFIVGIEDNHEMGLMPLVYNKKDKAYTYFGEDFPEQNKFFLIKINSLLRILCLIHQTFPCFFGIRMELLHQLFENFLLQ